MYRIYCLHFNLDEPEFDIKNTNFVDKMLQRNSFLNDRIWIIRYFQNHCQLLKLAIRDMPFETKLTPLVNTQGLTDSVSLLNDHKNGRNSGGHKRPKTFWA